jgi:hypothetical protein
MEGKEEVGVGSSRQKGPDENLAAGRSAGRRSP